ncbi:amino acid ABC transporter ATP-binding protein [Yoonia vestfoldensis]|jgi:polar amino acid transport system ATP-binding protein|uniref:Glutamine transport ATP-binding protein GlnQ n=1 Tax=Yoonia vestfoldensis TaxID=245188 RepID=A0A1Y0EI45_9RHOB|nr:amino acid ABC transporter ATP-binding protein [Yoonia vestfoldensis]ARU03081.1 glutamine transport ATP-binding protein GlnQ [Yoonia vestfoldensis]
MTTPMIEIDSVTKYFGDKLVLDRVSLRIAPHEVVCLIGASGSGKSTLLRCVNRLVDHDYGTIRLDGVPVDDPAFGKTGLQKRVAIVFQSYNLFPHMNVLDNITLAPRRVQGQSRAEVEDRGREVLARFGMAGFAASYPEQLSGGQQQRIAIARALMTRPDVLLLDEITAALDPELVGEVLAIIRGLKDEGMTMMIVTHEMGFARDCADRVAFLDGGVILEQDTPDRLFGTPQEPRTKAFLQRIIASGRL